MGRGGDLRWATDTGYAYSVAEGNPTTILTKMQATTARWCSPKTLRQNTAEAVTSVVARDSRTAFEGRRGFLRRNKGEAARAERAHTHEQRHAERVLYGESW